MKAITTTIAITLIAISSLAHAGGTRAIASTHESDYVPQSTTRAEVLADLAMWKKAGLLKYWRGENTPDTFSREYQAAYVRYLHMRHDESQPVSGK